METNFSEKHDSGFDELSQPKMSIGLNILTILTFIGSGIQLIGALFSFTSAKTQYDNLDKTMGELSNMANSEDVPDFAKTMMGNPEDMREIITKSFENRLPILLLSVVAAVLCILGAMKMRQLKKQGYPIYLIGELLPLITSAVFLGGAAFSGVTMLFGLAITLLFILLYTFMRKQLVY